MANGGSCATLVDEALARLRVGFEVYEENGGCRVVTPLLRRDNDRFELIVRPDDSAFVTSDDGETLDFLQLSGINTRKNRALERLLEEIKHAHGVQIDRGQIVARATDQASVGDAIVRALSAMSDLSQFELTRREVPPRTFDALVEGELVGQGLPYEPRVSYPGKIRTRSFRFGINGTRKLLIEPLRAQSATRAVELAAVFIVDVEDVWSLDEELGAIAVIDDTRDVWADRAVPDLVGHGVNVVRWTRRHPEFRAAIEDPRRGIHLLRGH